MTIKLATGPVTWGVDFADTPTNPPWQQVLDDIAASGLPAMELGPVGYLPEDPDVRAIAARPTATCCPPARSSSTTSTTRRRASACSTSPSGSAA